VPGDGRVVQIAEHVVGWVVKASRGRALGVDPIATMGVPSASIGIVTARTAVLATAVVIGKILKLGPIQAQVVVKNGRTNRNSRICHQHYDKTSADTKW
jgi:hypothetical protein